MKITGYADSLSVAVGENLTFRVSSESPAYRARLVRLIHGDRNPAGPGFKCEALPSNIDGEYPGRFQPIHGGSYALVNDLSPVTALTLGCWLWPTTPAGEGQVILSYASGAVAVELDSEGRLAVVVDGTALARTACALEARTWYFLALRVDGNGRTILEVEPRDTWPGLAGEKVDGLAEANLPASGNLSFAARVAQGRHEGHFNGKIENPWAFSRILADDDIAQLRGGADPWSLPDCLGAWDFSQEPQGERIIDRSDHARHGVLINMPARAMTGHDWSGTSTDFTRTPDEFGAIHFHDDDMDDAGWLADFTLSVPVDARSGIYAIHLVSDLGEDHIPFFVTPKLGAPQARIAFLASTFTYLAYGNEAIANRPDIRQLMLQAGIDADAAYPSQPEDKYIVENRLLSCYDIHSDGSGVCYSSHLRPLLNLRPSYRMPLHGLMVQQGGAPHLLNADLCITDWLEQQGAKFDVITDHALDAQGAELLSQYHVIVTGSHPEYFTAAMFDAFDSFCREGGRLMYLGGNGFFAITSLSEQGHAIEVRRGHSNRPWSSFPGELFHSTTGEEGGAWKSRARPSQRLLGVGTSAVGFTSGAPYLRTEAGRDARFDWLFDGVDDDEIGDFPNLIYGSGAGGWEIDRADAAWGTPAHAVVVATARLMDDSYQQLVDELEAPGPHSNGSINPNVRADMVYLEYPHGGAVFSVGSCLWAGSLSYNGYRNNVSVLTGNVLQKFANLD
jgi:N,N-dimethylformamidase